MYLNFPKNDYRKEMINKVINENREFNWTFVRLVTSFHLLESPRSSLSQERHICTALQAIKFSQK